MVNIAYDLDIILIIQKQYWPVNVFGLLAVEESENTFAQIASYYAQAYAPFKVSGVWIREG